MLEKQGYGFYIGGDVSLKAKKWIGFNGSWLLEDTPIVKVRCLLQWHNFISGCTGWNLKYWKLWVGWANKMECNSIKVSKYGYNQMSSFDFLRETKTTGYFNNSINGRDWGNQHINDVREMVSGGVFENSVYGAEASFANENSKVKIGKKLMNETFEYAGECGTKVISALDFDTWMSHPENVMTKMPKESVFNINGYLTSNPEHPEGFKYYKNQIQELLKKYPQVDELTAWSRAPNNKFNIKLGTIWMAFCYEDFSRKWKKEFDAILQKNLTIKRGLKGSGLFAFSKIVKALEKAASEVKPELQIGYGSWNFHWLKYADILMPKSFCFRPLYGTVEFEKDFRAKELMVIEEPRNVYPIVWAHHDDFAHIGRPYKSYSNLPNMLISRDLDVLRTIHWTIHSLDLYFTGTAKQLWSSTANQTLKENVDYYVKRRFGTVSEELSTYYFEWMNNGLIFGREISGYFVDLAKNRWKSKLKPWKELVPEVKSRISLLNALTKNKRNNYWDYQYGIEEFYNSFFENQAVFSEAYKLIVKGEINEACKSMSATNPEETIRKFVKAQQNIEFTPGEKALVLSYNTCWVPDFINLKQRLDLELIRVKFTPTKHDPLAQIPGENTYSIDENGKWWICYWKNEVTQNIFLESKEQSALTSNKELKLGLKT